MTNTNIHTYYPIQEATSRFERIYTHTLLNISRTEDAPSNTALQILGLLSDAPRHHMIHALELWLFCEARKIYSTIEKAPLRRKVINRDIIRPFMQQLSPELRRSQKQQVEQLVYKTLTHMGFSCETTIN